MTGIRYLPTGPGVYWVIVDGQNIGTVIRRRSQWVGISYHRDITTQRLRARWLAAEELIRLSEHAGYSSREQA